MNREEIMNLIPHRDNMLLLDSSDLMEDGTARGSYTVRGDEWFLQGHFPGNPVVPGVVLCEIMGQNACVLLKDEIAGKTPYYAGMKNVRFRKMVRPGDTLALRTELIRSKLNVYVVKGEARVGKDLCASGEFSFILAGQEA